MNTISTVTMNIYRIAPKNCGLIFLAFLLIFSSGCSYMSARNKERVGTAQFLAKDYEKSTETLEKSIALRPGSTSTMGMLGWSYFKEGKTDKALDAFYTLYCLDSRSLDAHEGMAWCYVMKGWTYDAIREFKTLLFLDFTKYSAYTGLGWNYYQIADYENSLKSFQRYHMEFPADADGMKGMGFCYFQLGEYNRAIHYLKKVAKRKPELTRVRHLLAKSYYELGDFEKSIKTLHSLTASFNDWADPYVDLGWNYAKLEKYEEAQHSFAKAKELNPYLYSADIGATTVKRIVLTKAQDDAWKHYKENKYDEAVKHFKQAIKENPLDSYLHSGLAWCYYETGNKEDAKSEYSEALNCTLSLRI
jgi:tetratricopeptide (TPR) repeat protein